MSSASGRRKPSRSSSAIVADKERGRHDLNIDVGTLDAPAPAGAEGLLASSPFTLGGHRWRIRYYPNRDGADSKGWVSVYLLLDEDVAEPVTVRFRLSLVTEMRALFFIMHLGDLLQSADLLGTAVRVDGVEPWAFKALLRYAYTDSLPEMDKVEDEFSGT
ncbi:unnamed protein product [Urochloa decumbens]|uniref:MATH domain-containing protein n=1 Tax=Urochloa decumbens TaxID=240449 RepID=A0ABC8VCG0_9POAL